ncbi:hypothetical protein WJX73_004154 [Symbiochloris irregularis]|uniref:rRNA methyltransferase 2, mitochondrial n=1 Tax=Symbiochloris irregularis TaxID=706552 RepID=A0AAW1PES1_9CHLO
MSRNLKDFFFKQAKRHGFLARSAFKLTEIQERFRVIRAGGSVLDLGCCPGAWIQVALQAITAQRASTKPSSLILGVDLKAATGVGGSSANSAVGSRCKAFASCAAAAALQAGLPHNQSASLSDAHETSPEGPQPGGVLLPEGHLVVKI